MDKKRIIIRSEMLFDGRKSSKDVTIIVEDEKIIDVTPKNYKADYKGVVTPAFIDAHSHIGLERYGEPSSESEANDRTEQFLPINNPLNSIYFDDVAFEEAVDFGVLYSCVVPGSGNVLGGKAMIIKNFARNRKEALLKDFGYKMALGYNPRSTEEWKGTRPNTRMGIYGMLEKKFDSILIKEKKGQISKEKKLSDLQKRIKKEKLKKETVEKEKKNIEDEFLLEFDSEEKALLEILKDKRPVKIHVHKEDDILYLIELVKKYRIKITVDHAGDVFHTEIFNELAAVDIPVVYGPLGAFPYKVELNMIIIRMQK